MFQQHIQQNINTAQANLQQQNMRTTNTSSNLTAQQLFNQQRNHLYQKYGQQMIGNAQIKQQNRNLGNAQAKAKYNSQMRFQQQVNVARVQNQLRIQQAMEQKNLLTKSQKIMPQIKQMVTTPQSKQMIINQKPYQPRPTTSSAMPVRNNPEAWKSRQVTSAPIVPGRVRSQNRFPVPKLLNNGQLGVTPIGSKVNQPAPKTQQQLRQQEMINRISQLQKQKSIQQNIQTKKLPHQNTTALPDARKRQLEEMKNSK